MFEIALLGAGRIGQVHARNVAAHPELRLKYVVDPNSNTAEHVAAQTGARVADLAIALGDAAVVGVIVASPTNQHLEQCLAAAAAGKAILCEKPLDLDLHRAMSARSALTGTGIRLLLGFNRRFDPHFATLKERLDGGTVGTLETLHIISHDPAPPPAQYVRSSGGLFKDMAIHDFDMARWLLGEEPSEVHAAARCLIDPSIGEAGDVDTAKTLLTTASGRLCVISNSRRSGYGYDQRIEAFGSRGLARADNVLESTVSVWSSGGMASDVLQNFFLDRYASAYRRELAHFAKVIANEASPAVGYADGIAALVLAEAAAESVRVGAPIRPRN
ncbi:MAG: inositol 2-dehydrogenase [Proteobacteria bacterium]|nr:inositol 2-dehydrogenase [Pseudomonadota bacterium]